MTSQHEQTQREPIGLRQRPLSILYFGNQWAAENRTSSHHVAMQLAESFDVHYVECPGLRAPIQFVARPAGDREKAVVEHRAR